MTEATSNTIDITDPAAVQVEVGRLVKAIWKDHIEGLPLVIAVNLTASINGAVLNQLDDPHKLLYAIERNAVVMEHVMQSLAERVGHDKMEAAMHGMGEDGETEVLH